jgi:hypothetical protein
MKDMIDILIKLVKSELALILFLIAAMMVFSCQKEENQPLSPNDTTVKTRTSNIDNGRRHRHNADTTGHIDTALIIHDTITPSPVITIGDEDSMLTDNTQRELWPYEGQHDVVYIDVNNDSVNDLMLKVAWSTASMGTPAKHTSLIEAVNVNTSIYGIFTTDTIYSRVDTSGFMINSYSTCHYLANANRKSTQYAFHGRHLLYNDQLNAVSTFSSTSVSFIYSEQGTVHLGNYAVDYHSLMDCYAVPYGQTIYIGFIYKDKVDRLGWVKLQLLSTNRMQLKQWAIQRIVW